MESEIDSIISYVEDARIAGHKECVYNTHNIKGEIYTILQVLKTKLPLFQIWYVDPVLARCLNQVSEMWGIHIKWAE